ncbi:cyclic nucleotide-binding domain-containing protein 2-like [Haliotis rubra]|uniref:cyclic nucleotide-binding domain-containing protein 2-like n=1 Tax=Haliotis rubra TaxID=36100 RepID=UPI001EE60154|nr:cyclic nucleotide-binding domain-containing protein 2-like [Haliotis rubra]
MATTAVWDYNRFCLDLIPQPKKVYNIKYINIELPPPPSRAHIETCDYDDQFEDTDEEDLSFSDDDEETSHIPERSLTASRAQTTQTPSRGLVTAIGDCLLLSSSEYLRNTYSPDGIRWTTSAKEFGAADNRPHTTRVRRAQSRRRSSNGRRPHTVAPDVPTGKGSLATSAYVSRRMRYLLDSRASICPNVLTNEILPLYQGDGDVAPIDLLDGEGEEGDGLLTGRKCRRFRKRVLNYIRQRRVLQSFEKKPKTDAYRKFRMVGSIVTTLVHMLKAISANTDSLTTKSAAEIQWQALYSDKDPHKLAFNVSVFTRERAIEKLPMWSIDILQKNPEVRDDIDCRKLHTLLKGMRSFDKFTEKIQNSLCKTFSYMCFQEGRVIIRQGHVGQNFYLIYSGSVFVNVMETGTNGKLFVKNEAVLTKGDSFGELALLQDIRRTATIVVRETCELLVVEKNVFSHVCPRIFEIELEEKEQIMKKLHLFNPKWWSESAKRNLALTAQIQDYKTNKVIVPDSVREEWIYVCIEGNCQVIRCLEMDKKEELSALAIRRRSTVLLSDEILDLLGSFPESKSVQEKTRRQSKMQGPSSTKEKLLGSLGLDYVDTGRRQKAFIEAMEQVEKKKALSAVRGHMTLTSFMKDKLEKTTSDLVFLHVAVLDPHDIFDLTCVLNPYQRLGSSSFMLVSGGARILRIRRDHFQQFAPPAALEYTRTQAFKQRYPTDDVLIRSYKEQTDWDAFKGSVVRDVKSKQVILPDRRRFYKKAPKVKDKKSQVWTFLVDNRVVELKSLQKRKLFEQKETSAAERVWSQDHRPEVVRSVPENFVMRRHRSVRFSANTSLVRRFRPIESKPVSKDEDEVPVFNKGKRRSVSIKLPIEEEEEPED